MDVKVKFLGGASSVTGSKYLLEIDETRVLVDCGLFQGLKELRLRNWNALEVDPKTIDIVILTHAHIDHSGYLPKLVRDGFSGKVYCTDATADLLQILLSDSAKLQEEEAIFARKKGYSKHQDPQPLYFLEDVKKCLTLVEPQVIGETVILNEGISVRFELSGHILGAASVVIKVKGKNQEKIIVFSGDIGRYNDAIHEDPTPIKTADILFVESTYGAKANPIGSPMEDFAKIINAAIDNKGCLLIPAFSVGRTQMLLYYLAQLFEKGLIPKIPVYIDSPMAISVTSLYRRYDNYHKIDADAESWLEQVFDHPQFNYIKEQQLSAAINNVKKNAIIISASGMCTGGRILHHLYHRLPRKNDTVLFVGYQGEGTRGRRIVEGEKQVKIFGQMVSVDCEIASIDGFSAHADQPELLRWLGNFISHPKITFLVHGEEPNLSVYKRKIFEELGQQTIIPKYMESFILFDNI
jgi:metallo-beta-lactamase family protein